jgi:Phytanoyl-CoA dioxygenase (PhyH)
MANGLEDSATTTATDPVAARAAASALAAQGHPRDAIALLMDANRRAPDAETEEQLVALRHAAFDSIDRTAPSSPPPVVTPSPTSEPLREYRADELTPAALREAVARSGCLLVRGLLPRDRAEGLARGIDRALDGFDAEVDADVPGAASPWYSPFVPQDGRYRVGGRRKWVRASGAVWTVDSPHMLFELCELLDDTGVGDLVAAHLGERPSLSANKCTLRRVPVDTNTNWHQDGAFLGAEVRSMNLWLALSDTGPDSPGLEIVPRRFDEVLPTGTEGAMFDWSVSPRIVDEIARDTPVLSPTFRAGDALLFDHMLLHRTAVGPDMTRERYAMETWLFAPSTYPEGQIPVVF